MARLWDVSVEDIEEFQSCGWVQNVSYGDQRVLCDASSDLDSKTLSTGSETGKEQLGGVKVDSSSGTYSPPEDTVTKDNSKSLLIFGRTRGHLASMRALFSNSCATLSFYARS